MLRKVMDLYTLTLVMVISVSGVHGYNILCYHPIPTRSHDLLAWGLISPLLRAGHKITWVTPFPAGKPDNVTVIDVSQTIAITEALDMGNRKVDGFEIAKSFADNITKVVLTEDLRRTLTENQYDAVISEWFFSEVEAGFAAVQKVPWIVLSGFPMHRHLEGTMDSVSSILSVPALGDSYPVPLNFWDRLKNSYSHLMTTFEDWVIQKNDAAIYEAFFRPVAKARNVSLPPYSQARRDVAVLLVNDHPPMSPAHSLPPNVVPIGGFHIQEHTPLPKDLQEILDSARNGVVYFSMGTVVAGLPEKTKKDIIEVLGSIPYTVLWKFEEQMENLPKNIHVRAWMPQSSILAHPNMKVFITHCGMLSNLETVHYGVPILALPVFADQPTNADKAVRAGYGVKVTFRPDMKEDFRRGLNEILTNDRYYKKAKSLSRLFRNRPVAPSTLIRHYVELAIESKGAHHLRPSSHGYTWTQIWMLDQFAVLLLALIVMYLALRKIAMVLSNSDLKVTIHKDKKGGTLSSGGTPRQSVTHCMKTSSYTFTCVEPAFIYV